MENCNDLDTFSFEPWSTEKRGMAKLEVGNKEPLVKSVKHWRLLLHCAIVIICLSFAFLNCIERLKLLNKKVWLEATLLAFKWFVFSSGCDVCCIQAVEGNRQNVFRAVQARHGIQLRTSVISFRHYRWWCPSARHLWHWHERADASGEQNYEENDPARWEADLSQAYPAGIDDERQKFLIRQTRCD